MQRKQRALLKIWLGKGAVYIIPLSRDEMRGGIIKSKYVRLMIQQNITIF